MLTGSSITYVCVDAERRAPRDLLTTRSWSAGRMAADDMDGESQWARDARAAPSASEVEGLRSELSTTDIARSGRESPRRRRTSTVAARSASPAATVGPSREPALGQRLFGARIAPRVGLTLKDDATIPFPGSGSCDGEPYCQRRSLALIDAYWRAANYLSVGQIYLFDNPLLKRPLKKEDIKPRLHRGHWGTTPGLNFIYAHLNRLIKKRDLDMIYITGPGHGGPAAAGRANA